MRKKTSRSPSGSGASFPAKQPAKPAEPQAGASNAGAVGLLIAVELGADFPVLIEQSPTPRRVLAQMDGETPAAFADRVASSLEGAFGRGVALGYVTLACNERIDEAAQSARRQLAGAALGAMARQNSGKVSLSAPGRSSGRLRHALSALARGLHDEWRTAGLEASIDFGDATSAATTSAAPFIYTARVA